MLMIEILTILLITYWFLFLLGHIIYIPYFTDSIPCKEDFK
jgi:hypothetical protein